jgi:Trk K+ transport system NAD-binding subunit
MRQHFILCGLGKVGWRVLEQLRAAGTPIVAIDNHCAPDDARLGGTPLIQGDCRNADVLRRAGLEHARGVVILTSDDLVSLSTALLVRNLHPTIRVVVRLFNHSLIARLGSAMGNMQALSTSALAAPLLALIASTGEALGMVRLGPGDRRLQIADLAVTAAGPFGGRRLGDFARQHEVALVAHLPAGQPPRILNDVASEAMLAAGDRLIVCGPPEKLAPLLAGSEADSLPQLLWANIVKRFSRVFARMVVQVDWPVKICTGIFLSVLFISILVFHFGMKDDTLVDAFYRTISLLATGADMHGDEVERGSWQKAFISGLRLVGTALTAAFTAIFANYLIRANLGGALEIRRIPESGHFVVCGLGNVGFRAVEELLRQGEQVVAIEANGANPFIATARRLGAAVIVGNATIAEVLRQARASSARAVIAATNSELVNLEVSLLVRELAPKQRVVLRLTDAQLAQTLRQSANIRLAVSIPELAAPTFVAALYGDQVHGIFHVERRALTVYDLIAREHDTTLREITLRDLAAEHRFLPLALTNDTGAAKPLHGNQPMTVGDQLTVIVALDDLQRLMRRDGTMGISETIGTTQGGESGAACGDYSTTAKA